MFEEDNCAEEWSYRKEFCHAKASVSISSSLMSAPINQVSSGLSQMDFLPDL